MPYAHIKSLPFKPALATASVLEGLTTDLARATGISIEHLSLSWEFIPAHQYAAGGHTAAYQPLDSHPVMVDLLCPDFITEATLGKLLTALAHGIAERTGVQPSNVFINHRQALSGHVFDGGEIVQW